ncbi:MAG: thioredoxin family protein [Saprospiraceae bacterium]|nr:thioredoxin family protein [Saprospiraceae bacterium]
MKFQQTILLLITIFSTAFSQDKNVGINFFHGTFKEALDQAKSQDKLLFMDAYTTWCGPCKRMSAMTFPDPTVGEYYNTNFINIKVDMEKEEGPQLAQKYSVGSYPTLLYIDGDGKVVYRTAGMRGPEDFIELGKEVMKKIDKSAGFEKMYNEGKKDGETVLAYIKSLNASGKPSLKIANDYLSTQKDLSTPVNLEIIFESTREADSKVFDYMIQYKNEFAKKKNPTMIDAKIYQACMKTFQKSLEYRNEELLKTAQQKMTHHSSKTLEFTLNTDLEYYARTNDAAKYTKAFKKYTSKLAKKDPSKLTQSAQMSVDYFRTNPSIIKLAEKSASSAVSIEGTPNQYLLYATILKLNGKYKKALEIANKGLRIAREKMQPTHNFEQLIQELQ